MTPIFVDTDYLYAMSDRGDSLHGMSVRITKKLAKCDTRLYLSDNILLETMTLVSQRVGKNRAIVLLEEMRSGLYEVIHPNRDQVLEAESLFAQITSKNVSYSDCLSFVVARSLAIEWVLSFDIHFKKQGFSRIGVDGWF